VKDHVTLKIGNSAIFHNNITVFTVVFYQINVALGSKIDFFQKHTNTVVY